MDITCPGCGTKVSLPEAAAGRPIACPRCHKPLEVPGPFSATAPTPKICTACRKDLRGQKRVKDPQGLYYCESCYAARQNPYAATQGTSGGSPQVRQDVFAGGLLPMDAPSGDQAPGAVAAAGTQKPQRQSQAVPQAGETASASAADPQTCSVCGQSNAAIPLLSRDGQLVCLECLHRQSVASSSRRSRVVPVDHRAIAPPDLRDQQYRQSAGSGTNGFGLAGFIISLVSVLTMFLLAPVGLILSIIGLRKAPRGLAIAGVIIGGFFTLLLPLLLVAILLPAFAQAHILAGRAESSLHLHNICQACTAYAHGHQNRFPPNFAVLVAEGTLKARDLIDPNSGRQAADLSGLTPGQRTDVSLVARRLEGHCDYILAAANQYDADNQNQVLAYERAGINHGNGGNVAFADGVVFWLSPARFQQVISSTSTFTDPQPAPVWPRPANYTVANPAGPYGLFNGRLVWIVNNKASIAPYRTVAGPRALAARLIVVVAVKNTSRWPIVFQTWRTTPARIQLITTALKRPGVTFNVAAFGIATLYAAGKAIPAVGFKRFGEEPRGFVWSAKVIAPGQTIYDPLFFDAARPPLQLALPLANLGVQGTARVQLPIPTVDYSAWPQRYFARANASTKKESVHDGP